MILVLLALTLLMDISYYSGAHMAVLPVTIGVVISNLSALYVIWLDIKHKRNK